MAIKKYWCELCKRSHKNKDTYLQHKERLSKKKEKREVIKPVKKGVSTTHSVSASEYEKLSPGKKAWITRMARQKAVAPRPTVVVSDDPKKIAIALQSNKKVKIVATETVANNVKRIMPKYVPIDVTKIPVIKVKPGQDMESVKKILTRYTCKDCEYFVKIDDKNVGCRRWHGLGKIHMKYGFSVMKDIKPCSEFRRDFKRIKIK